MVSDGESDAGSVADPAELRRTFLFEGFSDGQLSWLIEHSGVVQFAAGEPIVREGEPADALWVLLDGQVEVVRTVAGRELVLAGGDAPGTWTGWLPVFPDPAQIGSRTLRPSRLLRVPRDAVRHLLTAGFPVATHLLAGLTWGIQNFEATTRQQEKLAALGKLAAGLAHDLNNPAAAAGRAAADLDAVVADLSDRMVELCRLGLRPKHLTLLLDLQRGGDAADSPTAPLDPLARSDQEDALAAWLADRGVVDGWDLAPTLVDAGLDRSRLEPVVTHLPAEAVGPAVAWLAGTLQATELVAEVKRATARISELIDAVKRYSYMDQAPSQEVDVHEGLESTLTMLGHALKGVAVQRDYDPALPRIAAFGGELNQVWTNLIDNAADALGGRGRLVVRTRREDSGILVEIEDDGPGIPPSIRDRVFEPFFTTKGVGDGTGLGLDITRRIVLRHDGDIRVESRPGETRFQVRLPLGGSGDGRE